MRTGIQFDVDAADPNSRQKHAWRAKIVLATVDGFGTLAIARQTGRSKPCVWRWQERFMGEGVGGLLRDKSRKPGIPPRPAAAVERVVELTLGDPPGEATHWTGRAMAAAVRISLRSMQRIWRAHRLAPHRLAPHRLAPHRVRTFKLSRDPAFVPKLRDVVGLYVHPPPQLPGTATRARGLRLSLPAEEQRWPATPTSRPTGPTPRATAATTKRRT